MGTLKRRARQIAPWAAPWARVLSLALAGAAALGPPATPEESEAARATRWHDVAQAIFNGRPVQDGSAILQVDAPPRALDAALVPVSITVQPAARPKTIYMVIDDNPAPVAAIIHFGPLADPHMLKLRVRVDQYTLLHAVAELPDGRLVSAARFIKAAGGCSAPGSTNPAEAMARIGRMKLFFPATPTADQTAAKLPPGTDPPSTAELLISHPNFNGMQMDPVTRLYTPARYVQTIKVSEAGQLVFTLDGDISLSQDPAISFAFHPVAGAPLQVEVNDSAKAVFRQTFPLARHAS